MVDLIRGRFDPGEILIEILVFELWVSKEKGMDEFGDDDCVGFGGNWNEDCVSK